MRANLAAVAIVFATIAPVNADIVEEETWYNADGEVVKTVKRTITGADARTDSDWEPAWVARERGRDARSPYRYRSGRSSFYYPAYYGGSYLYSYGSRYCARRSYGYRGSGFRGYVRVGGGAPRWGFGYRGSGVSLFINR